MGDGAAATGSRAQAHQLAGLLPQQQDRRRAPTNRNLAKRLGELDGAAGREHAPEAGRAGLSRVKSGASASKLRFQPPSASGAASAATSVRPRIGAQASSACAASVDERREHQRSRRPTARGSGVRLARMSPCSWRAHVAAEQVQAAAGGQHDRRGAELGGARNLTFLARLLEALAVSVVRSVPASVSAMLQPPRLQSCAAASKASCQQLHEASSARPAGRRARSAGRRPARPGSRRRTGSAAAPRGS